MTPPRSKSAPPSDEAPPRRPAARTLRSRFQGCLLGGAVGDALGAPIEFMRRAEIEDTFGPSGLRNYAPAYGRLGAITDDTQMMLFTAEGILRAWVRGRLRGLSTFTGVTAYAYLRWLETQGERNPHIKPISSEETGWLYTQRALHQRRAPGNTCLSALIAMKSGGEPARNRSKGCGGVMRIAPVGLFQYRRGPDQDAAFELGADLAALTHGQPTGSLTAGVLAVLVMALVAGQSLADALDGAKAVLVRHRHHEETLAALLAAERLAASTTPAPAAIAELGEGWVAEEALAIGVYCALVAKTFRHGVLLAVNHDGDSDSTGSIAGNLLGAERGVGAIPKPWLEALELRDVIAEIATDLYECVEWDISEYGTNDEEHERIWAKYPGF